MEFSQITIFDGEHNGVNLFQMAQLLYVWSGDSPYFRMSYEFYNFSRESRFIPWLWVRLWGDPDIEDGYICMRLDMEERLNQMVVRQYP